MDWDKLRIFHAAAEAGSFTHAGEALGQLQAVDGVDRAELAQHGAGLVGLEAADEISS